MDGGTKWHGPASSDCGKIPAQLFPAPLLPPYCSHARLEKGLFLCPMEDMGFPGKCRPKGSVASNPALSGGGAYGVGVMVERPRLAKAVFLCSCMLLCGFIR